MFEHLDPDARRIFELAQHEASDLRHNYIGTEHLLVALAIHAGATARLLAGQGCGPDEIRGEIVSISLNG